MDNCLLTVFGYSKQLVVKNPSLGVVKNSDIGVTTPGFESSLHVNSVNLSMLLTLSVPGFLVYKVKMIITPSLVGL